jgi:hypothetical protein
MKKNLSISLDKSQLSNEAYDWMNISIDEDRVGKARCKINGESITIYSINIFPEFQGKGYGTYFVDECKNKYKQLIADRVRFTAIGFWEKMKFVKISDDTWTFKKTKY